ncbi:MAG: Undecaprenyl-diphosphatase [uncultured Nocardioidaceae bacterium]|uniref:Undecaprenyl-diphosphatase n=1 Tax=uncultured Nocardioidaceae bacterium TaxID=253824 RepID=A0A6J4M360_9ACTN|nr:MAG: Undecaprenyl-diphosphatase [uncultured Nocardioidaceae bacterium]
MEWLRAIFLGLLQGLTEFLPISSSAHLRIVPELLGWEDPGAAFTAVIQIGTELAVLLYFRHDIWRIASSWLRSLVKPELRGQRDALMGWYIILGSLPVVLVGIALKDVIETEFRNLWIIGVTLIGLGLVLGLAERFGTKSRPIADLGWRSAVLMGLAQALSVIPGVSRSGATISMGLFLGYEREAATRFAFLLAIPAVVGAGLFELPTALSDDNAFTGAETLLATVVSFIVGYATIAWLLRYVSTRSYAPFVIYRVVLGAGVLALLSAGVLTA